MLTPDSATRHYRRVQRLQLVALAAMRRAWRRMEPMGNWERQYREDVGPKLVALAAAAQVAATVETNDYVPQVLDEVGIDPDGPAVPRMALAGWAGDGRPVESLMALSVTKASAAYTAPHDGIQALDSPAQRAADALASAEQWIMLAASTLIADSTRAAEAAAIGARPQVGGYVRMLNPPSCSRCAVLAGRFYRWNSGFERHPRCDCVHIPASEAVAGDLRLDPDAYFESLPTAADLAEQYPGLTVQQRRDLDLFSQEDIFTDAGARAIREGADLAQVVNARRGMRQAQVYGHDVLVTMEGTTRRGVAYRALNERFRNPDARVRGERYFRTTNVRLMPESIFEIAKDRDDAIRLLRLHGFIS